MSSQLSTSHPLSRRDFLKTLGGLGLGAIALSAGGLPRLIRALGTIDPSPYPFDLYLTFDNGPFSSRDFQSGPTDKVLNTLRDKQAHGTFFLHGIHVSDWEGPTLVRYLHEGHAIGNHLWAQPGNLVENNTPIGVLAEQYLVSELRIRERLKLTDEAAYQQYMAQPKLYRRTGGNNGVTSFLKPKNQAVLKYDKNVAAFRDKLNWLVGVYDYSGWHVNSGDTISASVAPQTSGEELLFTLNGGHAYYGVNDFIHPYSVEAGQGLIILMHDQDANTYTMLPDLVDALRGLGANFRSLPRPIDRPNSTTVGIAYKPTPAKPGSYAPEVFF